MEKMMRGRAFSRIKNVFRRGRKRSSSETGCNDMIEASYRSTITMSQIPLLLSVCLYYYRQIQCIQWNIFMWTCAGLWQGECFPCHCGHLPRVLFLGPPHITHYTGGSHCEADWKWRHLTLNKWFTSYPTLFLGVTKFRHHWQIVPFCIRIMVGNSVF